MSGLSCRIFYPRLQLTEFPRLQQLDSASVSHGRGIESSSCTLVWNLGCTNWNQIWPRSLNRINKKTHSHTHRPDDCTRRCHRERVFLPVRLNEIVSLLNGCHAVSCFYSNREMLSCAPLVMQYKKRWNVNKCEYIGRTECLPSPHVNRSGTKIKEMSWWWDSFITRADLCYENILAACTIKIIRGSNEELVCDDVTLGQSRIKARGLSPMLAPLGTNLNSRRPLSSHLGKRVIKTEARWVAKWNSSISQSNEAVARGFFIFFSAGGLALIAPQVCQPRERASARYEEAESYFFASRIGMRQKEKRQSIHVRKVNARAACWLDAERGGGGRIRFERPPPLNLLHTRSSYQIN